MITGWLKVGTVGSHRDIINFLVGHGWGVSERERLAKRGQIVETERAGVGRGQSWGRQQEARRKFQLLDSPYYLTMSFVTIS